MQSAGHAPIQFLCFSSPTREYVYAGGALLAKLDSTGTKYYHQDHLSNRMVTSSTGSVVAEMGHFPFGESWYNATNDKLNFTTYEYDSESGNHYAMARYDVSRLGRLSSPDPIAGDSLAPQSLNRYAYSTDDPVSYFDPLGLCPKGTHSATQAEAQKIIQAAEKIIAANTNPGSGQHTENLPQPTQDQSIFDEQGHLRPMDCTHFLNVAINKAGYSVPYATTSDILSQSRTGQYFQLNTTSVSVGNVALMSFRGQQPYGHAMLVSSVAPLRLLGSQSHTGPASVPNAHFSTSGAANEMSNAYAYSICIPDSKDNGNSRDGGGGGSKPGFGDDGYGNPFRNVDSGGPNWCQIFLSATGVDICRE